MVEVKHTYENSIESTVNDKDDSVTTVDGYTEQVEHYPSVLESAPFPALASLDEITQTLSKIKSTHTQKSTHRYKEDVEEEKEEIVFKHEPYHTEGLRNPGWMSVISCFLVNFFVFGTTFSWGNYQNLYLNDIYAGQTNLLKISFVGTSATALMMALGLFLTPVIQKLGFRGTMVIGTIFVPVSLILASFATQLWHIYLSQGILYGIAASFVFSPSVTLPAQWFTARRSLATGIAVSGSGIGGVCLSPMIEHLIQTVGYRNTLRIEGCFGFGLLCISTALAVSRYRPPQTSGDKWYHMFDRSLLSPRFVLLLCFGFFVPFGYIAPFFLAPQFVLSLGLGSASGAAMISVMSASNAICRISLGYLADKVGRFNTLFLFTFFSGFFTMVIWQNASNYATFAVYCVLFGLTAGGFVSLLPVTTADIVGVENIQRGLGMAYMTTVLGNLLGTPIIGLLFNAYGWTASIQFAGSMTVTASLFVLALRFLMTNGKIFVKV